jgi:hypothetical protein
MTPPFAAHGFRSVMTHVGVGMGAASFWRGAWYLLDDHLYPDDAPMSAASSWGLGVAGILASQGLIAKCESLEMKGILRGTPLKVARFGAMYTIAMSCILVWRGTWVGWDVLYERYHPHNDLTASTAAATATATATGMTSTLTKPRVHLHPAVGPATHAIERRTTVSATDPGHATNSGALSHVVAIIGLVATGLFASVLAPPAATGIIRDLAVKSSATQNYSGPAQKLAQLLWHPSPAAPYYSYYHHHHHHRAQTMIVQRNYMTKKTTMEALGQRKFHSTHATTMTRGIQR